jgi:glutathione peroxidase
MLRFSLVLLLFFVFYKGALAMTCPDSLNFKAHSIQGEEKNLCDYKGHVLLVVNVASRCGFTKQYKGLEKIYARYKDQGFKVLAFPANNFGSQEPGSNEEIQEFCQSTYNVTFDLFAKENVKGPEIHPFYKYLTTQSPFKGDISWNFNKFLIDASGTVVARYGSRTDPEDKELIQALEEALKSK